MASCVVCRADDPDSGEQRGANYGENAVQREQPEQLARYRRTSAMEIPGATSTTRT